MSDVPADVRRVIHVFGAIVMAIGAAMAGYNFFRDMIVPNVGYLAGGMFLALGAIVYVDGAKWTRDSRSLMQGRVEHRREPWLWRDDWAAGTSEEEKKSSNVLFVAAIVYTIMLLPYLPQLFTDNWLDQALTAIAVPIWGAALFRRAKQRKQGRSVCRLRTVPIRPGSTAAGTIETSVEDVTGPFALRLQSLTWTNTPSKDAAATVVLWETEATVARESLGHGVDGLTVPFSLAIPETARNTRLDGEGQVEWRLTAKASTPGTDYVAVFDLPVFDPDAVNSEADALDANDAELRTRLNEQLETMRKLGQKNES